MSITRITAALCVLMPSAAFAQAASISGDIYLSMKNGQVAKGAATTVRLVSADSLTSARRVCGEGIRPGKKDKLDSADAAFARILIAGTRRVAKTGVEAHYTLDSIPPGSYVLWSEMRAGLAYAWFVPVTVKSGEHQTLDLDNSNVTMTTYYCMKTD